jgi:hypothetical protein
MSVSFDADDQEVYHHTEYHAVNSKLLAMASIVFQKKHVSSTTQEEEQEEDGVDWDIWDDRRHLAQSL